ncbi:hypothetical protein SCALM49S_07106 [Streptomyces californicus]
MPYEVRVCGAAPGLVAGGDGLSYHVAHGLDVLAWADIVFIPGYRSPDRDDPPHAVVDALIAAHDRGAQLAAISTGAFALGPPMAPRTTNLMSYPEGAARARMQQLRDAVGACSRFSYRNTIGKASVTTEELNVPALGENALRYRTLSRLSNGGFAWNLVTAVRVGGVIATMHVLDTTGPMPPEKLAKFKPDPGPDETAIATLIKNVTTAQSA